LRVGDYGPGGRRADNPAMRSTRLLIIFAAIAAVALPVAGAQAASRLSLHAADRAAHKEAADVADNYSDDQGNSVDSFDLSPCAREGARRASCDVTYTLSDGEQCDDTITVRVGAHRRLKVTSDSDDGGDTVFVDCTDPNDTSASDDGSSDDGSDPGVDDGSGDAPAAVSGDVSSGFPGDDGSNL
jgi:hypothetical protein